MKARGLVVLDRDGVLNAVVVDPDQGTIDSPLHPSQVQLLPGVREATSRLARAGYTLCIATNQPAAAKGKTTLENLRATHAAVLGALGAPIASSHLCLHRSEDACACRKPKPGLVLEALAQHPGFEPDQAWLVGDGLTDVQAGAAAGLKTAFLGPQKCDACKLFEQRAVRPTFWGPDLPAFVDFLLRSTA